jgi:hypothetical protein
VAVRFQTVTLAHPLCSALASAVPHGTETNDRDFAHVELRDFAVKIPSGLANLRALLYVRYWHLADIDSNDEHVCFWG